MKLDSKFQVTLANQTTQYRAIERRLLSKLRERTVQPLVGLDKLLADTHHLIVTTSHAIEDNTQVSFLVLVNVPLNNDN